MPDLPAAIHLSIEKMQVYSNLRFTPRQLFYEVCRAIRAPKGLNLSSAAAVFAAAALAPIGLARNRKTVSAAAGMLTANALVAGGLYWLRRSPHTLDTPVSFAEFENALENYLQKTKRPNGLLEFEPEQKPNFYPTDLPLYGLPRILICQSAEIAAMLRANQFHLEASVAVLGLAEAAPLPEVFQQMMLRAENTSVCFLHDASFAAFSQILNLREKLNLPENVRLQVLGLRPVHAARLHLFAIRGANFPLPLLNEFGNLSETEKRWLADGFQTEIAAVNPIRLMRVLRRLILGLPARESAWQLNFPPRKLGFMS